MCGRHTTDTAQKGRTMFDSEHNRMTSVIINRRDYSDRTSPDIITSVPTALTDGATDSATDSNEGE